jgi:type IV pilus biogenesis protein CpaD/CtpE
MKWLAIAAVALLVGCSSSPKVQAVKPQYCNTSQTIKKINNDTVNSETTLECTDDQIKRLAVVKAGIASNCGYSTSVMLLRGKYVEYKVLSCAILNSNGDIVGWEYVNN